MLKIMINFFKSYRYFNLYFCNKIIIANLIVITYIKQTRRWMEDLTTIATLLYYKKIITKYPTVQKYYVYYKCMY